MMMMMMMICMLFMCCTVIGGCALPDIANGIVVEKTGGFIPGDRAVIHCSDGYVLMPRFAKPVIICSKDGTWTTDEVNLPTCVGEQCELIVTVVFKGELNLDNKWQSDDLFYIIMNEIHPRFNQFCVILKIS